MDRHSLDKGFNYRRGGKRLSKSSWRHVNTDMARGIKRLVWTGYTQSSVAHLCGISQPTVSRIVAGADFADVLWPDGTKGALSDTRKRAIKEMRNNLLPMPETLEEINHDPVVSELIKDGLRKALTAQHTEEDDRRLREAIALVDDNKQEVVEKVSTGDGPVVEETPTLPFTEIWKKARKNPYVKKAMKNKKKQKALELVFANIPEDQWDSDMAGKLLENVEGEMK
jgi:predicted transcriptional regulator